MAQESLHAYSRIHPYNWLELGRNLQHHSISNQLWGLIDRQLSLFYWPIFDDQSNLWIRSTDMNSNAIWRPFWKQKRNCNLLTTKCKSSWLFQRIMDCLLVNRVLQGSQLTITQKLYILTYNDQTRKRGHQLMPLYREIKMQNSRKHVSSFPV